MAKKTKTREPHQKIVVGLPDLQDQLRIVDRLVGQAGGDTDQYRLENLGELLSNLYIQLQHQKQVTIYRFGSKSRSKIDVR